VNISYEAAPVQFSLGPDTTLCPGESILLNTPQSNLNITWQDGSHGLSFIADHALLYTLQLSNDCGTSSDDLLVSVDTRMPVVDAEPLPWCEGDVITLDVSQSFSANYLWDDGSVTPVIQVDAPGMYGVEVSTDCQSVHQDIEVVPGEDCKNDVYVPTVFTPNGDGVNDVFTISVGSDLQVVSLSCSVFDRWGNMVYNAEGLNFAWDGRFQENELLPGVYVYQIILDYISRNEPRNQIFSGDVTLVR
jgi:gliding motility-associated-like protein